MAETKKKKGRRKRGRVEPLGRAFIQATFNNTIITITGADKAEFLRP